LWRLIGPASFFSSDWGSDEAAFAPAPCVETPPAQSGGVTRNLSTSASTSTSTTTATATATASTARIKQGLVGAGIEVFHVSW
jgi:hypothetical protein